MQAVIPNQLQHLNFPNKISITKEFIQTFTFKRSNAISTYTMQKFLTIGAK
ncbi:hypothetical protein HYC85_032225 [Camellia sinensis]|uniref:Uncharacterized protein n=1 Tax=Camellia sinensis TaxID=4442 RepID=A0A7J7FSQ6_CAMSI|nr:hypothetical protein HYC85_032225 [Camellia sinensis]